MSNISNERLEDFIRSPLENGLTRGEQMEMARELLEYLNASKEPVIWMNRFTGRTFELEQQPGADKEPDIYIPLYAAPPAPVSVPGELTREEYMRRFMEEDEFDDTFRGGWNACRAAILQQSSNAEQFEPVSEPYKLPAGWIAVPVEPTENMIIEGFESEPDESFSTPEVWEAYQAMSGCQQASHRAKLCWSAMLAAAPKMDDVNSSVKELTPKKQ